MALTRQVEDFRAKAAETSKLKDQLDESVSVDR